MVNTSNAIAAALALGAAVHIRNCAAGLLFRVDIEGAITTIKPAEALEAIDRYGVKGLTISGTARKKLSKWALKWGGPERRKLVAAIRRIPTQTPMAFGTKLHETLPWRINAKTMNFGNLPGGQTRSYAALEAAIWAIYEK